MSTASVSLFLTSYYNELTEHVLQDKMEPPTRDYANFFRLPISNIFRTQSTSGVYVTGRIASGIVQVGEKLRAVPGDDSITGVVKCKSLSFLPCYRLFLRIFATVLFSHRSRRRSCEVGNGGNKRHNRTDQHRSGELEYWKRVVLSWRSRPVGHCIHGADYCIRYYIAYYRWCFGTFSRRTKKRFPVCGVDRLDRSSCLTNREMCQRLRVNFFR